MASFGEVRFCFGKNASPALHFSKEVKAASRQGSSAFFGRGTSVPRPFYILFGCGSDHCLKERIDKRKCVMIVTFCGHGDTQADPAICRWLNEIVSQQIEQGADLFYLGGYGGFDRMAASTVWALKQKYSHIRSVLVLPYLDRKIDASLYDYTTYPPLETVPRRYAISRRNQWMVEQADIVIACVNHGWGGAAATLTYARRKKKGTINYYSE